MVVKEYLLKLTNLLWGPKRLINNTYYLFELDSKDFLYQFVREKERVGGGM